MDPRPTQVVIEELRTLLAETEAGQQPSNPSLSEAVWRELRPEIARACA
jgi:hypothetical protein